MVFQYINIRQEVPWERLKTAALGLGFQHLPQDLANVNAWKTMFDPYIDSQGTSQMSPHWSDHEAHSRKIAHAYLVHELSSPAYFPWFREAYEM